MTVVDTTSVELSLVAIGVDFPMLRRESRAVVLFGSRAAGLAAGASDWDLLVVDGPAMVRRDGIDIVSVRHSSLQSCRWRACDLSSHVEAFGVKLFGEDVRWDVNYHAAAERKLVRIRHKLRLLESYWSLLSPFHRKQHSVLLRRDIQRYWRLLEASPVPRTAILDQCFEQERDWCVRTAKVVARRDGRLSCCFAFSGQF